MRKEEWSKIGEEFKQMNVPCTKLVFDDEKRKPKSVHSRIRRFLREEYNVEITQRKGGLYLYDKRYVKKAIKLALLLGEKLEKRGK